MFSLGFMIQTSGLHRRIAPSQKKTTTKTHINHADLHVERHAWTIAKNGAVHLFVGFMMQMEVHALKRLTEPKPTIF